MSREDVVAIASRLFSVFLLITTIRAVSDAFFAAEAFSSTAGFVALMTVVSLASLAVAALLWYFPLTIARKLLPVMKEPKPLVDPVSRTALELALTVIGIWVLATAVMDLTYWIVLLAQAFGAEDGVDFGPHQRASLVALAVEFALGLWLGLGSRGVVNLVQRLRYAGRPMNDDDLRP